MTSHDLATEWCLLQNQFDSYEKHSLYIKLTAIIATAATWWFEYNGIVSAVLLLVLWGQDAIWKTFQSRIETRLLVIEQLIADKEGDAHVAFQFNRQYQISSHSGIALIREYLSQAVRPTIAFPHVVLLPLLLADMYLLS